MSDLREGDILTYEMEDGRGRVLCRVLHHFRPDTSFPFLALARKLDVPYAYVLWVADAIERGDTDENGRVSRHIHATMRAEAIRRSIVQNGAVK